YPFHVALRIVGSLVTAKRWRGGDVEPTWEDPSWAVTSDTAHDSVQPPAGGGVGLMTNHLHSGAWVEFGDVEIIRYCPGSRRCPRRWWYAPRDSNPEPAD